MQCNGFPCLSACAMDRSAERSRSASLPGDAVLSIAPAAQAQAVITAEIGRSGQPMLGARESQVTSDGIGLGRNVVRAEPCRKADRYHIGSAREFATHERHQWQAGGAFPTSLR